MSTPERKESPVPGRRGRRSRAHSSSDLSVEELTADDMGYDADIEVIKPDKYEEFESDSEEAPSPRRTWQNVDEELAARMRHLGREQTPPWRPSAVQGRKRRSLEMDDDNMLPGGPPSPDLEVQELAGDVILPSPAKRRRKRSNKRITTHNTLSQHTGTWTDLYMRDGGHRLITWDTSASPSSVGTAKQNPAGDNNNNNNNNTGEERDENGDDHEMMDVT